MYRSRVIAVVIAALLFAVPSAITAQNSDESLGYRYRISFEISDPDGPGTVQVYTNTWIRTGNGSSLVWLGSPHPDLKRSAEDVTIVPSGCIVMVGRGVEVLKRSDGRSRPKLHTQMTISHSVQIYDFVSRTTFAFNRSDCGK